MINKFTADVMEYAWEHYDEGWHLIAECYSEQELSDEFLKGSRSLEGAIKRVQWFINIRLGAELEAVAAGGEEPERVEELRNLLSRERS